MNCPEGTIRLLDLLKEKGVDYELRSFETPAHHAKQAAALLNCPLGAVVKSLVFKEISGEKTLLVLVSGSNRVDLDALTNIVGAAVKPAHPRHVQALTGYEVGAVPPFGVNREVQTIIDADLMTYDHLWAAAGCANILIRIASSDLYKFTGGQVNIIKQK